MEKLFMTELKQPVAPEMQRSLRLFYAPIIGANAATLYLTLMDFHYLQEGIKTFQPLREIRTLMQLDEYAFENELKKLEATGLLRRFVSPDESKCIFVINAPQGATGVRQNAFLYKALIAKIGELMFEKFEFAARVYQYDKSEFQEVTTKFQDLFALQAAATPPSQATTELNAAQFSSLDDAMKFLAPAQFFTYLTEQRPSPSQAQALQRAQHCGLSPHGINALTHYVIDRNQKFVTAHFDAILNDFESKGIRFDRDVILELNSARSAGAKTNSIFSTSAIVESKGTSTNDQESWDEIFKSLIGSS